MQVLSFDWRSPFSVKSMIGLPPAQVPAPVSGSQLAGLETSDQVTIPSAGIADLNQLLVAPPSSQDLQAQQGNSIYDPMRYGDAITQPIVFAGAGEVLALRRSTQIRTRLLIFNKSVIGAISYCFDRPADGASCIDIAAGGSENFVSGAIPQGDLHIFSPGAGTVVIEFINSNAVQTK